MVSWNWPLAADDPRVVYADEHVLLICSDNREVLPLIERVDHVITDSPYEAEAHTLQRRVKRGATDEPLSFERLSFELREYCAQQFARIARRWVLCFCQAEAIEAWRIALVAGGANYRRACVWIKPDGMPQYSGDRPGMGYESIVCAHAPGRSRWNGGGRHGVFVFPKMAGEDYRTGHETQKPKALMRELVRLFTDPGEVVLDPFAGSGTTGVACRELGRRCILIEREEKYCRLVVERLRQPMLPYTLPMRAEQQELAIETA